MIDVLDRKTVSRAIPMAIRRRSKYVTIEALVICHIDYNSSIRVCRRDGKYLENNQAGGNMAV